MHILPNKTYCTHILYTIALNLETICIKFLFQFYESLIINLKYNLSFNIFYKSVELIIYIYNLCSTCTHIAFR